MATIWIPKRLVEAGLVNVAALSPQQFVNFCENEYKRGIEHVAGLILKSKRHIVMLSGPSGSGKTTSSYKLAQELQKNGKPACVVSLDDFYLNVEDYPQLQDGSKDYENIRSLDIEEIHRCLHDILRDGQADFPEFDFVIEKRKNTVRRIELNSGVIIVEGIHALNPLLTDVLPRNSVYRVYAGLREEYSMEGQRLLPSRDVRLARRMVRDHRFRGQALEKIIAMWPMVNKGEDEYIRVFKKNADCLLDTSFSYEPCLLAQHVLLYVADVKEPSSAVVVQSLAERMKRFLPIDEKLVPEDSMLREFIG